MADDPSTAQWLLGSGGLLACGAGLKWLLEWWGKRDERRQDRLSRASKEESEKVQTLNVRLDLLEDKMSRLTIAVNILIAKEFRQEPSSPELQQVRAILGDAFPIHLHVPADMEDKLRKV